MPDLTLLCVHPHPDDESIACGGVLARYAAEGIRTHVVTCTGGEAGSNLAEIDLGDLTISEHRRREMADAIRALGVDGHTWLGFRDSGMVDTEDNEHPDAFVNADLYLAATRLARVIRRVRPDVIVSDDDKGTYGHPDHIRAHQVTERAVTIAADPWWDSGQEPWTVRKRYVHTLSHDRMFGLHSMLRAAGLPSPFGDDDVVTAADLPFGVPGDQVTTSIDVADVLDVKQAALASHRTQIGADSFFLNIPPELAQAGFGVEEFVLLDATLDLLPAHGETDLFAGLRG